MPVPQYNSNPVGGPSGASRTGKRWKGLAIAAAVAAGVAVALFICGEFVPAMLVARPGSDGNVAAQYAAELRAGNDRATIHGAMLIAGGAILLVGVILAVASLVALRKGRAGDGGRGR